MTNGILVLKNEKAFNFQIFLPSFIIFCINPIGGILYSLYALTKHKNAPKYLFFTFFTLLALWLGGINATKIPVSDQEAYLSIFQRVPERGLYNTLFKVWGETSKEPFYNLITYVGYYLCGGHPPLFFCGLTASMYMFHFAAIYKVLKAINANKGAIICGTLILAFFSQYFTLTNHLVRQMLAASIIFYAITSKAVDGKNHWYLLIISYLIHSSAGLLIVFSLLPILYKKLSLKKIILILICFIPIIVFNTQIGTFLGTLTSSSETLSYGFQRFADNISDAKKNLPLSLILLVLAPQAIIGLKKIFFEKNVSKIIRPIVHIFFLLMMFILSFYKNPLMQYRFFYYSYSFMPLLLPLALSKENKMSQSYYFFISLFFIIRFFFLYDSMPYHYAPLEDILLMPFPYLLFHSYYTY